MKPLVWGEPADEARVQKALDEDIPAALDYLEGELPPEGFLFGEIGVADIAIASFFRNAHYAGYNIDILRWPKTATFVERTLGHRAWRRCFRSRTSSATPASRAGGRHCSMPARGSRKPATPPAKRGGE